MLVRVALPVLAAAIFGYACGPHQNNEQSAAERLASAHRTTSASTPIASALDVNVEQGVVFSLHVTNASAKKIEVDFPSGLTHDFVVLDANGREVWRWSASQMFTQNLQNKPLAANQSATYAERWDAASEHGTFTAVAMLESSNYPVQQRVQFTLP